MITFRFVPTLNDADYDRWIVEDSEAGEVGALVQDSDDHWMFNPHYFGHNCENEICFFAKDLIQIASKLTELKGD